MEIREERCTSERPGEVMVRGDCAHATKGREKRKTKTKTPHLGFSFTTCNATILRFSIAKIILPVN